MAKAKAIANDNGGSGPAAQGRGTGCRFSKDQLLAANRFRERRDLLEALLSSEKAYAVEEVEKIVDDFYKRKVR